MLPRIGQSGNTLVGIVLAAGVLAIIGAGAASMQENFSRHSQIISLKVDSTTLARDVTAVMSSADVCSCQLNRDTNTARAAALNLDVSDLSQIPDIELGLLRNSCDFAINDNILAQSGAILTSSQSRLAVERVLIRHIRPVTSEKFVAILEISFPQTFGFRPISIPFRFSIDPAAGTPSTRKILNCGTVTNRIVSCPPNMELIGPPGSLGTFCIERNVRPTPAQWSDVEAQCQALNGSTPLGTFGLCHAQMIGVACRHATQSTFNTAVGEMNSTLYQNNSSTIFGFAGYGPDCGIASKSSLGPFRCCLFN